MNGPRLPTKRSSARRIGSRRGHVALSVLPMLWLFGGRLNVAAQSNQPGFFLPRNPVAAAYVLGRLSNRELIEAPRSEFVYVALLGRKGLERKYRLEALDGLAGIRHTSRLEELLKGLAALDQQGEESQDALRDLAGILLHGDQAQLQAQQPQYRKLATASRLAMTRQIGWAAGVVAEGSVVPSWGRAESNPARLEDLVASVPLVPDPALREAFYSKLKPLLRAETPPDLIHAAASSIVSVPGHDEETFRCLAGLVQQNIERAALIPNLARIPRTAWPRDTLVPLSQSVLAHLRQVPSDQLAQPAFADALQFASELAAMLPPEPGRALARALRSLGPTVVTLHAIYEQMRFDQDRIVAEPGKPLVIFLQNDDAMPHNLAVVAPGALREIGQAAEKLPPVPDAEGRLYVPVSPKVLHATRLVNPGQKSQLAFTAPAQPGDYPFLCTFPGHWLRMSGTLTIVPDAQAYLAAHPVSAQPKLTEWKLTDFSSDLAQAGAQASPVAGRELFSNLACVQCHKLGAQGYAYGPDLTGVFRRYNNDRAAVLDQILEPSKIIQDRYRNYNFELKSGDSLVGMVLKEEEQSYTIQTGPADALIQVLPKADVRQRRAQPSSPMPVGLLNALSKSQILDLLAYLESGGTVAEHPH